MTLFYLTQIHEKEKSNSFLTKDQKLYKCLEKLVRPDMSNQCTTLEKLTWKRKTVHFIFLSVIKTKSCVEWTFTSRYTLECYQLANRGWNQCPHLRRNKNSVFRIPKCWWNGLMFIKQEQSKETRSPGISQLFGRTTHHYLDETKPLPQADNPWHSPDRY